MWQVRVSSPKEAGQPSLSRVQAEPAGSLQGAPLDVPMKRQPGEE